MSNNEKKDVMVQTKDQLFQQVRPSVDVYENDEHYLVRVDLPGVQESDLDLTLDKDELTLNAHAAVGPDHLAYMRTFALPTTVDAEKLDASLNAGVLSLSLPKRPEAKPRKIHVVAA